MANGTERIRQGLREDYFDLIPLGEGLPTLDEAKTLVATATELRNSVMVTLTKWEDEISQEKQSRLDAAKAHQRSLQASEKGFGPTGLTDDEVARNLKFEAAAIEKA